VFADRSTPSKYQELKYVYSPVQFSRHGDSIYVVNRCSHLSLSSFKASYRIMENGHESRHGLLFLPDVMPGDSAVIGQASKYSCHSDNDCRLNIDVFDSNGNNVIIYQTALHDNLVYAAGKIQRERNLVRKSINDCGFDVVPDFYRAPTDNDTGFGNWLAKDWKNNRLDSPEVCKINDVTTEYRYPKGKIIVKQLGDSLNFECKGDLPELPCLGVVIRLPRDFEQLSWYGRGPWDSYPDRKHSAMIGLWKGDVTSQYTHYPRPQDNGNHEDCSMVQLKSSTGRVFRIEAADAPFSFSALHYSDKDIAAATHDYQLKTSDYTYLKINCAVLGLGNGSCGPGVLKKYSIDRTKRHTLKFRMYIR
jgi:beta-galactosidase